MTRHRHNATPWLHRSRAGGLLGWSAVCLAAAAVRWGPSGLGPSVKAAVRDICSLPTQVLSDARGRIERWQDGLLADRDRLKEARRQLAELRSANARLRERLHRATLRNAELRAELERLRRLGRAPVAESPGAPLLVPQAVRARVIGKEMLATARLLVETAPGRRLPEDALAVVEPGDTLIDRGADSGIRPQAMALLGTAVVGKVRRVGRWTATLQLVTDPGFRAMAQVVRTLPDGSAWGPEGVLHGDGGGRCRLELVDPTAVVQVGDLVCTPQASTAVPAPLCFGRVSEATFDRSSGRWSIVVAPAVSPGELRDVLIVTHGINPLLLGGPRPSEELQ
ncbi:MAG: rod shape-determining protein MreC [Planctomycetota bacterium]|nr:MAG: rod shape-determining protein MreC [Planctomycetota bacterium]